MRHLEVPRGVDQLRRRSAKLTLAPSEPRGGDASPSSSVAFVMFCSSSLSEGFLSADLRFLARRRARVRPRISYMFEYPFRHSPEHRECADGPRLRVVLYQVSKTQKIMREVATDVGGALAGSAYFLSKVD